MLSTVIIWGGAVVISALAHIPLYVAKEGEERHARIMAVMIVIFGVTIQVALVVAAKVSGESP